MYKLLQVCSSQSLVPGFQIWMDDLGATVPTIIKNCNLRHTQKMCWFWTDYIILFPQILWKKICTINSSGNLLLISSFNLPQTFSLTCYSTLKNKFHNVKFICRSIVAIFTCNKLHHFTLQGW